MGTLNTFDYRLLLEETVRNYCSNTRQIYPSNFKRVENIFFNEILKNNILWYNDIVYDNSVEPHIFIININTIVNNMLEFIKNNNTEYNDRTLYRYRWLPKKNIYSIYRKLNTIYEFGGIDGVYNLLEIYDQTYIFGDDSDENTNITSVVFIYDPKGDINKYDYSEDFPFVLYDNRLGNFLGIPIKYWNKIRNEK